MKYLVETWEIIKYNIVDIINHQSRMFSLVRTFVGKLIDENKKQKIWLVGDPLFIAPPASRLCTNKLVVEAQTAGFEPRNSE